MLLEKMLLMVVKTYALAFVLVHAVLAVEDNAEKIALKVVELQVEEHYHQVLLLLVTVVEVLVQ